MNVQCLKCKAKLAVPDEKASSLTLKLKCPGCGLVFPLAKAPRLGATRPIAVAPALRQTTASSPPAAAGADPAVPTPEPAPGAAKTIARAADAWRLCADHPQAKSEYVCPGCQRGFCKSCGKRVQTTVICPACETLCTWAPDWEVRHQRATRRSRSLLQDLPTILLFPFTDALSYVMIALLVWFFGLIYVSFATAFLMAATFHAVSRTASGRYQFAMPEFSDPSHFVRPVRLGFAVFLVCYGPLLLAGYLAVESFQSSAIALPVAHAQDEAPAADPPDETPADGPRDGSQEPEPSPAERDREPEPTGFGGASGLTDREADSLLKRVIGGSLVVGLALLWKIFYSPAALMVAAFSQSFVSTVNPVIGLRVIAKMGLLYGQVLAFFSVPVLAQWLLSLPVGLIPVAGSLVNSFTLVYTYLAVGCMLGLAVDKKAEELGVD